jgi:hypothetical protein
VDNESFSQGRQAQRHHPVGRQPAGSLHGEALRSC